MMLFITLTKGHKAMWVNPAHIVTISHADPDGEGQTLLEVNKGKSNTLYLIDQTVKDILDRTGVLHAPTA